MVYITSSSSSFIHSIVFQSLCQIMTVYVCPSDRKLSRFGLPCTSVRLQSFRHNSAFSWIWQGNISTAIEYPVLTFAKIVLFILVSLRFKLYLKRCCVLTIQLFYCVLWCFVPSIVRNDSTVTPIAINQFQTFDVRKPQR